jgi:hypothetical protein
MFPYEDVKTQYEALWGRKFQQHFNSENISPVIQFKLVNGQFIRDAVHIDDQIEAVTRTDNAINFKLE